MSVVPKETVEVIAQSIGVSNLAPDVAAAMAPDVEYRVREIMQEAIKCMRHSKRTTLTVDDIDTALKLRNIEPIYGFASGDSLRFRRADGQRDLYYIEDKDVKFKDVIEAPLPKTPAETSVNSRWLAIEGVQPLVVENASTETPADGKNSDLMEDELSLDIKLPVKLYFEKIREVTLNRSASILFKKVLLSLATDSGLQPLLPHFTQFISDEVSRSISNLSRLLALMRVTRSLLQNPHMHMEPYIQQLMPSIMTCLLGKRLGNKLFDNHWNLRDFTASLLSSICRRYGHVYHNLLPRIIKSLLHSFLDPSKAFPQHYGSIQGLVALGPRVIRLLILPNLKAHLQLLVPEMLPDKQKNEMKRIEARKVYGALVHAAGQCLHKQLNIMHGFLSPPIRINPKSGGNVASVIPNKRKASTDNLTHQPVLKKMATEGALGVVPMNSMVVDMQPNPIGYSTSLVASSVSGSGGGSSMGRQQPNGNRRGREEGSERIKASTVLAQAWKEDIDAGQLIVSLSQVLGESFNFQIPKPELSLFL